jgi:FMN-dependent NADH-azoreductase
LKLLRIDSSPLDIQSSFSRQLTDEFTRKWQNAHPDGHIITRDLAATHLSPVNAEWIGAAYTPEPNLTPRQREVLALSGELTAELTAADEYLFGVAMHNFSIPSTLKLWIDQIVRVGKTFSYENGVPAGLLQNKKATFFLASGGVYTAGTPMEAMNFAEPYLRTMFGFLGVTDTHFIHAGGTARLRAGVAREIILEPALASINAHFQTA